MPLFLTPTDTYPTGLQAAADGDNISQLTRVDVMQEYADALNHLKNRVPGAGTGSRTISLPLAASYNADARFTPNVNGPDLNGWLQTDITTQGLLGFFLPSWMLGVGTLTEVHLNVHGHGGTGTVHSALPASMPGFTLSSWQRTGDGGSGAVTVANVTDSSVDETAYETDHLISATGLSVSLDNVTSFYLAARGEASTNSQANTFTIGGLYVVVA